MSEFKPEEFYDGSWYDLETDALIFRFGTTHYMICEKSEYGTLVTTVTCKDGKLVRDGAELFISEEGGVADYYFYVRDKDPTMEHSSDEQVYKKLLRMNEANGFLITSYRFYVDGQASGFQMYEKIYSNRTEYYINGKYLDTNYSIKYCQFMLLVNEKLANMFTLDDVCVQEIPEKLNKCFLHHAFADSVLWLD